MSISCNYFKFKCINIENTYLETSIPAKLNPKTGRGIDECNGVGYCDDGGCTCILDESRAKKSNRTLGSQLKIVEDKLVSDSKTNQSKLELSLTLDCSNWILHLRKTDL